MKENKFVVRLKKIRKDIKLRVEFNEEGTLFKKRSKGFINP